MDGVEFYESVFDPRFCRWLLDDAREALSKGSEYARSNHHWDPAIVRASQPVLIRDYQPVIAKFILAQLKAKAIVDCMDFAVMNYAWSRLSYIPWHNDGHRKTAVTIYLNQDWDCDWGGLFLYRDPKSQEIRAIEPHFNCGLRNDMRLSHATTMVTMDAPEPRFTLQLFSNE